MALGVLDHAEAYVHRERVVLDRDRDLEVARLLAGGLGLLGGQFHRFTQRIQFHPNPEREKHRRYRQQQEQQAAEVVMRLESVLAGRERVESLSI